MARYTGPKHRLARQVGVNLLDKTSASLQKRINTPPGVHARKRKRRLSEFGMQLREKQKAKIMYGILEKQFKNLVQAVQSKRGDTAELIISTLESRLDNLVYRLGFAKSRMMARQLVSHGHVLVNGKKVSIPSFQAKVGDEISVSKKMENNPQIKEASEDKGDNLLPFIAKKGNIGKLARTPKKEDLDVPFDLQLIIEYYSR